MRFHLHDTFGMMQAKGLPIPDDYQQYVYPFTEPEFISHPFVDMIIQETKVENFLMASHVLIVKQPITLLPRTEHSVCTLYCMLKGNVECSLTGFPQPVNFVQGQYFLFCINNGSHRAHFEPGVYQSFHINFPPSFLAEIAPVADPVLGITKTLDQSAALTGSMWYPLYEAIEELRSCAERSSIADQRLVNLMEQMLLLVIARKPGGSVAPEVKSIIDESMLGTIQYYIKYHLNESLSLVSLARHFGLQPIELQELFVRRAQATLEEYVFYKRMEFSRQLLQCTKMTIPEIVREIGFAHRTTFSKAFRSVYKLFPIEARRPFHQLRP